MIDHVEHKNYRQNRIKNTNRKSFIEMKEKLDKNKEETKRKQTKGQNKEKYIIITKSDKLTKTSISKRKRHF